LGTGIIGLSALGATAYLMLMTTFMVYDDEGFVLMSLHRFLGGEALYDVVFSQYGPFPYLYHWLLTGGGTWELTHMFGRMVTLVHWLVCAVGTGWIAAQLAPQQRHLVGALGTLLAFNLLWQMVAEPTHPGSMISAVVVLATGAGVFALQQHRSLRLACLIGVTGAILFLTKVNVGLFFIAGAGAFALLHTDWSERWRPWARAGALLGLVATPWALMMANLTDPRVLGFALKSSLAGAGIWWILSTGKPSGTIAPRTWWGAMAAFAITGTVIGGFVLLRGTSFGELVAAVLIDPLHQPGHFTVPPRNSIHSAWASTGLFALIGWAGWDLRRHGRLGTACRHSVRTVRLLVLIAFAILSLRWPSPWGVFTYLDYVFPLLPLWLLPTSEDTGRIQPLWAWVALIALLQILHAYPVAGSQMAWGSFLSLALVAAGWGREIQQWRLNGRPYPAWLWGGAALVAAGAGTASMAHTGWQRYHNSTPLPFVGAGDIRLDDRSRVGLTALVQNATVHSDVLFTRQGMYSFNLWSSVPTPTARNATHWFWLLDEPEQADIIARLENERSAVIINEPLDAFLEQIDVEVSGPLQDYLNKSYYAALSLCGFAFHVPKETTIAPLGLAELFVSSAPGDPVKLRATVFLSLRPDRVQLVQYDPITGNLQEVLAETDIFEHTLLLRNGQIPNSAQLHGHAPHLSGIHQVEFLLAVSSDPADYSRRGVRILDAEGTVLADALFE
jgi:hypothetical protein